MLQPKRTKFRKQQKGRNRGLAERGSSVSFGEFALKAVGRGRMTARQIEAGRRAMTRRVRRGGKIWIRVFPDTVYKSYGDFTDMKHGQQKVDSKGRVLGPNGEPGGKCPFDCWCCF